MTVTELIKELKIMNPNAEVYTYNLQTDNFELVTNVIDYTGDQETCVLE